MGERLKKNNKGSNDMSRREFVCRLALGIFSLSVIYPKATLEKFPGTFVENVRKTVRSFVEESVLPTEEELGFVSTVGVYGGKLSIDMNNRLVWDRRGLISTIDKKGDEFVRTFDEHLVRDVEKLKKRYARQPGKILKKLAPGPMRYRGSNKKVLENIRRLGLEQEYGEHSWGIEIKRKKIFTNGYALADIYHADDIGSDSLKAIDRFRALSEASKYIRLMHDTYGAIGELNAGDIIFQKKDASGNVVDPVLNIPDIIYNPAKQISISAKKATDLLDFTLALAFEEGKRSGDMSLVKKTIEIILSSYKNEVGKSDGKDVDKTLKLLRSFAKRGRATMTGDEEFLRLPDTFTTRNRNVFSQHNAVRINFDKKNTTFVRKSIIEICSHLLRSQRDLNPQPLP